MSVKECVKIIYGAPIEGESPLPEFRTREPSYIKVGGEMPPKYLEGLGKHIKVLPYTVQDRYSRKRLPLRLKCVVLENEYLKVEVLPEYGGRIYSIYDKELGIDLVMKNPVIQPANLAIRNAWLSGGIEWNIGNIGHTYTTCDNVFCATLQDDSGNDFLRIYEFERVKSVFWQVDLHLPRGSRQLYSHVRIVNPFDKDTTTYWWTNIAVVDEGRTRVLASGENILSFIGDEMRYERLPHVEAMPGADISYPDEATRSFDFFIQPNRDDECTWEASAFPDGRVFFERSTPPLSFKKMFCWGNHYAGKHWQEFLSDKGYGYYAEIQAGIAPSQLHDKKLGAKMTMEWTQCFGGIRADRDTVHHNDYYTARDHLDSLIDERVSEAGLLEFDTVLKKYADMPIPEGAIIHRGSGFGALEIMRMEADGDGEAPKSMRFPQASMGHKEYPWRYLLENGVLPPEDKRYFVPTYNVSDKWLPRLEKSLDCEKGRSWYSLMQYGIAVYEGSDGTKFATDSYSIEDRDTRTSIAEKAWLESVSLEPSAIVYRNLAILETQRGDMEKAERYYDLAISCVGAYDDFGLISEHLGFLANNGKYEKLWEEFETLPDNCKKADRIRIRASVAAVRLVKIEYLENFFKEEHYDIKEGENTLTDVWFEFCARKLAKERDITLTDETLEALIDEAWNNCPPDPSIDFRMSFDRSIKYRG